MKRNQPEPSEGRDICSVCDTPYPYGTLLDIGECEFDLICQACCWKAVRQRRELLEMLRHVVSTYRTFSRSVPRGRQCWTQLDRDTLKAATLMLRRCST